MSSLPLESICKSNNEFSFLSTILDLVGNRQFKAGSYDALHNNQTHESNIWESLSAIGQEIGGIFLANINNFIDNIYNIDTCGIKGLQSIANIVGTKYNIFNTVTNFPQEVMNMLDILSIKKEYLINANEVNSRLVNTISTDATTPSICATASVDVINAYRTTELTNTLSSLSLDWHSLCVDTQPRLHLSAVDNLIEDTFKSLLYQELCATYNDVLSTKIYENLSDCILNYNFDIPNTYDDDIDRLIKLYDLTKFDVLKEADNIDNGRTSRSDYSEYELKVLDLEFQRRSDAFSKTELSTRYAYYKEIKVKQYFEFVRNYYLELSSGYISAETYNVDDNYFVLGTEYTNKKSILTINEQNIPSIETKYIDVIAKNLTLLTESIREIRQQLKIFCQKNFMKGTFLLISYVINEYLKSNTVQTLKNLYITNKEIFNGVTALNDIEFDTDKNYNSLIEYVDPVNYFNISATYNDTPGYANGYVDNKTDDSLSSELNPRFWQVKSTLNAIAAIDNTNIFSIPPTVNANMFAFNIQQLSSFYCNTLKTSFKKYSISTLSNMSYNEHLTKFLSEVFDLGADKMYKDSDGNIVYDVEDNALSTYKEELYNLYSGDPNSDLPYYYYSNTVHPSYQIHPYLSTFMEKSDYSYPIENIASIVESDIISLVKEKIDEYIDNNGYLINLWKNPLGANQDYLSHYEKVSHKDDRNLENCVVGYDGLFYPKAIYDLKTYPLNVIDMLSNDNISCTTYDNKTLTNYYYGIDLTNKEREKIVDQLTTLSSCLTSYAFLKDTTIYKYGLDMYGNVYILVKDKESTDNYHTIRNKAGILFVKQKNHPIAFPAYVIYKGTDDNFYHNKTDYSYFYSNETNDSETNNILYFDNVGICDLISTDYKTPEFFDFFISIDKQDIAFVLKTSDNKIRIPIATINKLYNNIKDLNYFSLNKIEGNEVLYSTDVDNVKFACFTNLDNKILVLLYKYDANDGLTIYGAQYNYDIRNSSPMRQITSLLIQKDKLNIKDGTHITFDADNDGNLIVAYISNSSLTKVKNYSEIEIDNYSTDNNLKYLTRRLKNNIATKIFKVGTSIQEVDFEDNVYSQDITTSYYNTYTDNGFFGILSGSNDISKTQLTVEYEKRGIGKFLLVGPAKNTMIDFKFCLPVRMYEGYDTLISVNLAPQTYAHYLEDVVAAQANSVVTDSISVYEPITVSRILNGNTATLRLDEEYFNLMSDNKSLAAKLNRLYSSTVTPPYLWYSTDGILPEKYFNPGHQTDSTADSDNFFIKYTDSCTISCSWKNQTDGIALDFNTAYYNSLLNDNNYFNEKHCFLHLEKPGEAGLLNIYNNGNFSDELQTLYIKNISDTHPKFIMQSTEISKANNVLLFTEYIKGDTNEYIALVTDDNKEYQLQLN